MLHFISGQLKKYIESESFGLIVEPPESLPGHSWDVIINIKERLRESLEETKNLTVLSKQIGYLTLRCYTWISSNTQSNKIDCRAIVWPIFRWMTFCKRISWCRWIFGNLHLLEMIATLWPSDHGDWEKKISIVVFSSCNISGVDMSNQGIVGRLVGEWHFL